MGKKKKTNKKRVNVMIHPDLHEKAKRYSLDMLGEVNISQFICVLIDTYKPKKQCKPTE